MQILTLTDFALLAKLVSELISDPYLRPLSLGIFGRWGTGKSTHSGLAEAELAKTKENTLFPN
ncbi:MAG: P-loop NTPase fold protein [Rhizobiaceae bacterium]